MKLSWDDFKSIVTSKNLRIQMHERSDSYRLLAFDNQLVYQCSFLKEDPASVDQLDFETNFKAATNLKTQLNLLHTDDETGGLVSSPKWSPEGWHQVYHEIEFKTSQTNSIHDKNFDGTDLGFSTIKFYNAANTEITDQAVIDTDCVKTIFDFMPTFDIAVKSGMIAQIEAPTTPVYMWAIGAPGIADVGFVNGGLNLEFLSPKTLVGMDGTAATLMPYSHPLLGAGQGTNKIRFICRHNAGIKHRIQAIFEYFKA